MHRSHYSMATHVMAQKSLDKHDCRTIKAQPFHPGKIFWDLDHRETNPTIV